MGKSPLPSSPTHIITAQPDGFIRYLYRIWNHRHLVLALAHRDRQIRFAQTLFGTLWVVLQPLLLLSVYTLFFAYWMRIDTAKTPYILFSLCGIVCWNYFSQAFSEGGASLLHSHDLVRKIYFPKLILPLSKLWGKLPDLLISQLLLLGTALVIDWTQGSSFVVSAKYWLLPVAMGVHVLVSLTAALWICLLSLRYRDIQHILPYLLHLAVWFTPVFYPPSFIPEQWQLLLQINPMAAVLALYRHTLLGTEPLCAMQWGVLGVVVLLLVLAIHYFRRTEKMWDV